MIHHNAQALRPEHLHENKAFFVSLVTKGNQKKIECMTDFALVFLI